jgi:Holliday junction resolvase RusA-like endonuclease
MIDHLKDGTKLYLQTMQIYEKPYSLNQFRNENYYKLNKIKMFWNAIVTNTVMIQKVKPVNRANIHFEFNFKSNVRRDSDNMVATVKFILDGLVHANILEDDNFSFVEKLMITKGDLKKDCITINLYGERDESI